MSAAYHAEALRLGSLLTDSRQFVIPSFQRSYSWTAREVRQLLEDLWLAVEASARGLPSGYPDLHLGNIVLFEREPDETPRRGGGFLAIWPNLRERKGGEIRSALRTCAVIDGKQRLVTLSILCAALRERIGEDEPWLASVIDVPQAAGAVARHQPRLELGPEEESYFGVQVRRPGSLKQPVDPGSSHSGCCAIRDAQKIIAADLAARDDSELVALSRFLEEQVWLTVNSARDIDQAYQIFVRTNHRGKPLQSTDILRAMLIGELPEAQREPFLQRWLELEAGLGNDFDSLPGLLKSIYGDTHGANIRETLTISESRGGAERFMSEMFFPLAEALLLIVTARHTGSEHSPRINRSLTYLNWLKARDWLAPVLALASARPDRPDLLADLLERIERLAYALLILSTGSDRRGKRYREVTEALADGHAEPKDVAPLALSAEEQRDVLHTVANNFHGRAQAACKVVLKRLSASYPGDFLMASLEDVTVEHVLPRNTAFDSPWREAFPDPEEREACVQMLGNLVLIDTHQNKLARNYPFATKREIFFSGGARSLHAITNQLLTLEQWTPAAVRERDETLLTRFAEMWQLAGPPGWSPRRERGRRKG